MFACNVTCTTSNWLLFLNIPRASIFAHFPWLLHAIYPEKRFILALVYHKFNISIWYLSSFRAFYYCKRRSTNSKYRYWFSQDERMKEYVQNKWNGCLPIWTFATLFSVEVPLLILIKYSVSIFLQSRDYVTFPILDYFLSYEQMVRWQGAWKKKNEDWHLRTFTCTLSHIRIDNWQWDTYSVWLEAFVCEIMVASNFSVQLLSIPRFLFYALYKIFQRISRISYDFVIFHFSHHFAFRSLSFWPIAKLISYSVYQTVFQYHNKIKYVHTHLFRAHKFASRWILNCLLWNFSAVIWHVQLYTRLFRSKFVHFFCLFFSTKLMSVHCFDITHHTNTGFSCALHAHNL